MFTPMTWDEVLEDLPIGQPVDSVPDLQHEIAGDGAHIIGAVDDCVFLVTTETSLCPGGSAVVSTAYKINLTVAQTVKIFDAIDREMRDSRERIRALMLQQ